MTPETVEERSARLATLVEHAYARPVRFTLGLFVRALPFWAAAALLALWIRFDRTLAIFFGTLIAAAVLVLLFRVETFGAAIAWVLAFYGALLLVYAITRLRVVNDLFIRRIEPIPRCADGALLAPGEAPALEALIDRAVGLTGGQTLIPTTISADCDIELVEEVVPGSMAWRAMGLSIGMPMLLSLTSAQLEARIVWLLTMRRGGIDGLIRFVDLTLGLRSWLDRLTLPRYGGVYSLVDRLERHLHRAMGDYQFCLGLMGILSADARVAMLIGRDRLGESMCAFATYTTFTTKHWLPAIWRKTGELEEPPVRYLRSFRDDVRSIDREEAKLWVSELAHHDLYDFAGTPPLGRRLAELGVVAAPPEIPALTAADELFDRSSLEARLELMDAQWRDEVRRVWRQRHELERDRKELHAQLESERLAGSPLAEEDLFLLAQLTESVVGPEQALQEYRGLLERYPDSITAMADVGRLMVAADDDGGVSLLDRAIDARPEQYLIPAYQFVFNLAIRVPDSTSAVELRERRREEFLARFTRLKYEEHASHEERETLRFSEGFIPHGIGGRELMHLRRKLARYPQVCAAYLVRRDLEYFPHIPSYLLAIDFDEPSEDAPPALEGDEPEVTIEDALAARAALEQEELGERIADSTVWLGEVHVVSVDDPFIDAIFERIISTDGACVYVRDGSDEERGSLDGGIAGELDGVESDGGRGEHDGAGREMDADVRARVGAANAFGQRVLHGIGFIILSWMTFAPFAEWRTALVVFAVHIAGLAFLLRRGISWVVAVASLLLTPYVVYPVASFVKAVADYGNGAAALLEADPEGRFASVHWNDLRPIDPHFRVRWKRVEGNRGPHRALIVSGYNLGMRLMIGGFGPADGAYDGPLPSPDEARAMLRDSGMVVELVGVLRPGVERRGDTLFIPNEYVEFYRIDGFIGPSRTIVAVLVEGRLALYGSQADGAILNVVGLDAVTGERILSYQ